MKQLINTKELCKQIRKYGKRNLIWSRQETQHFITNHHFLVRFEELPKDVLVALFGSFYKELDVGVTMQVQQGEVLAVAKPIDFNGIYAPNKQDVEGKVTAFIQDLGNKYFARVIKFTKHYALANDDYLKLSATDDKPKTKGESPLAPIYLAGGDLMVLPYRSGEDLNTVRDLLGANKR